MTTPTPNPDSWPDEMWIEFAPGELPSDCERCGHRLIEGATVGWDNDMRLCCDPCLNGEDR
jgi:hypothetical protein